MRNTRNYCQKLNRGVEILAYKAELSAEGMALKKITTGYIVVE